MEVEPPCDCLSLRRWFNVRLQHWQQHQHFNFYCRPTTCTVYEFVFASTTPNITLVPCHTLCDIKKQLAVHGCIVHFWCLCTQVGCSGILGEDVKFFVVRCRQARLLVSQRRRRIAAGLCIEHYRTVSIKGVWFWPWWWCQIQWILQRNESGNGGCTGKCLGQLNSEGLFEGHFVDKIVPGT